MRKSDSRRVQHQPARNILALPRNLLISLRPRPKTVHVSQEAAVFETDTDGLVPPDSGYGLFVHETRLLSKYLYLINGERPQAVAASNVHQHSWMGYYVAVPPGTENSFQDFGSGQM